MIYKYKLSGNDTSSIAGDHESCSDAVGEPCQCDTFAKIALIWQAQLVVECIQLSVCKPMLKGVSTFIYV